MTLVPGRGRRTDRSLILVNTQCRRDAARNCTI